VILTDVVMDGMRGPAVVSGLRAKRPGVGVIYMSGYAPDILNQDEPGAFDAFVPKPFSTDTLARAVNRVMLATRLESPAAVLSAPAPALQRAAIGASASIGAHAPTAPGGVQAAK
jgi:DNA-binding NtrC family response regulator